jgi:hypothetical protein
MTTSTACQAHATLVLKTSKGIEMSMVMEQVSAEAAGAALEFPAAILAQLRGYGLIAGDGNQIDLADAGRVVDKLQEATKPLIGKPILISAAATKYKFTTPSIYKWIAAGWVKVLVAEPRQHVDEGDMALAKAIADLQGHLPGRAVFPAKPRSGRPRKQK